jgi:hypothetical protein
MSSVLWRDVLSDDKIVSTVKLPFPVAGYGLKTRDNWYETMVFPKGSYSEIAMNRYKTLAEAEAGHREMVKRYGDN